MNLTFLNPFFLFGLAAAALPILIHRLIQRRAVPRKFSAVGLLLQSQKVRARPERLKHFLLLALRVLAVISLVLLVARPVMMRPGLFASGEKGEKILVLDNSMSMGFMEERGQRYAIARKAAREVVEALRGKVMIIPTASPSPDGSARPADWMGPEEALRELTRISLSFGRGDPGAAFGEAYRRLKDSKKPGEILVITDLARGDWERFDLGQMGPVSADVRVRFLRIGGQKRDANLAVSGVSLAGGEAVKGVPVRLEAVLSNFSDQPQSTLAELYLSGIKADQKTIKLGPGEEGKAQLEAVLDKAGWVDGEVRLSGDRLALDDLFYFTLKVKEKVRVLIVDGDPKTSLKASESYYLVKALHPGRGEETPFLVSVITEEELARTDPRSYDALFLLNVRDPPLSRFSSILDSGRPVFIFLGDRTSPESYNSLSLLPWRIRELNETDPLKPEKVAQVDQSLEPLKSFSGPGGESLKGASFRRYFRIEGSTKNLLLLGNKDPLLVEADSGRGKVFLFASTADADWNDLPMKGAYLPLIQGLLKDAVGLTKDSHPASVRVGDPFPEKVQPVQLAGPRGGPGIYELILPSGEVRRGVNAPLDESDLAKMTPEEIRKRFGAIDAKVVEYEEGGLGLLQSRKELWPFVLLFVLAVLVFETVIANGFPWTEKNPITASLNPAGSGEAEGGRER